MPEPTGIRTAVGTLGKYGDVHIPTPLLQHAKWLEGTSIALVAEWIEGGRLRLHVQADISEELESRRAQISDDRSEEMAIFLDMYREVKLRFSRTQGEKYSVALNAEAASHLGIAMGGDREVYLEAREGVIDILSPACRNKRLRDAAR